MSFTVKELKDDAIVSVKVNKSYYMMVKNSLFYLFNQIENLEEREALIKETMSKKYEEMSDWQRSFYTLTLLLADIERNAVSQEQFIEKEIEESAE